MSIYRRRPAHLAIAIVCLAIAASSVAQATVTVRGKVEYWDQLRGGYFPCRYVHVEVEGDWFWFPDPDVVADVNGRYSATIPNPPFFWNNYDGVDIEVYAETDEVVQVFSSFVSWWPYHAISHETNNVKAGQTVTIDMRIGGPSSTAKEAYYRTMDETANAFALHDRALEEHRTLRSFGWPASDFDETEFLVPAASPTGISYYNHATGFANIALESAGLSGLGPWDVLPKGNYQYGAIENIRQLVQHEYAHGIHDELTGSIAPLGLSMPTYHSPEDETDRYVAYTEGLAYFLPLAVNNYPSHLFEASRAVPGQFAVGPFPESGNHYAMEAEVTGLLWDLFDGVGPEPFRHPAVQTADSSLSVPVEIVNAQRWMDRIQDPKLMRFRDVARTYVPLWPVMTIGEFLEVYHQKFPAERHALKSIAHNRDITVNMPAENPAVLTGAPKVNRIGPKITFSLELAEPDPEDRPFVCVFVWLQQGSTFIQLAQTPEQQGWTSGNHPLTFGVNLPVAAGPGDFFWIVVSDDMRPQAYRVGVPANMATVTLDLPKKSDLPKIALTAKVFTPDPRQEIVLRVPGRNVEARVAQPDEAYAKKVGAFRDTFARARAALASYGEIAEAALRRERGLYKLGRTVGNLPTTEPAERLFHKRPPQEAHLETLRIARSAPEVAEFEAWKGRIRQGRGVQRTLSAAEARQLQRILDPTESLSRRAASSAQEIAALQATLRNALGSILQGAHETELRVETQRAVTELETSLARTATDANLIPLLGTQEELIERIAGAAPPRTQGIRQQDRLPIERVPIRERAPIRDRVPITERPPVTKGRDVNRDARIPQISGRWRSNILSVYDITQEGTRFNWRKLGTNEVGQGTIDGTAISASWQESGRPGSANGQIVEVGPDGVAARIVWKNGVVFMRN